MAVLTPSLTGWNIEYWQDTIEEATYQEMVFIQTVDESRKPGSLLHIRKNARVTGSTLATNHDGTNLAYLTIIGTPVTLPPTFSHVPIAWSEMEQARLDFQIDSEGAQNINASLAELTETAQLANVPSLTQSISVADVDGPTLRRAFGQLMGNTNGVAVPGGNKQVYGIFSHTQYPNLGQIPEFNQADIRGDSENPYIKGVWTKGGGIMLLMSTVVANDGNGWHNCLYLPSAFAVAWNSRSQLTRDRDALQNRLIAWNDLAGGVKNDLRAVDIRTTNNPL